MSELSLTPEQRVGDSSPQTDVANPVHRGSGGADWRQRILNMIAQPAVKKSLPVLCLLVVLIVAASMWLALREPPHRDLFRGLPEQEKAAVVAALEQSNIFYSIDASSGALTVTDDDYHRAKIALAAQGLPKAAPDGDSLISSMPMGASRAVENEKLRSAKELDIARTIEAFDVVVSARVHLAVDAPSIFIRDRNEPSASVMLNISSGRKLADSQVRSIVHLVASSVPGLSIEQVSVVDQNGRFLSKSFANAGSDIAEQQLSVQAQMEERYRSNLLSLLTPVLGADNFTAEVNAELEFGEKQATRESFPKEDARIRSEQGSWSNENGERPAYGIPGALSNRPPEAVSISDEFDDGLKDGQDDEPNARTSEKFTRQFELGREVSVTKDATGTLRRLSVAVALRSPVGKKQRSKEELEAVELLVKGAVGFDADRGDVVIVEAREFQPVQEFTEKWWEAGWVVLLVRNLSALLVALALIFGIGRPLLRKIKGSNKPISPKLIATEIDEELQNQQTGTGGKQAISLDMIGSADGYSERATLVQKFVHQNPDHAALVVQELLAETGESEEMENV